MNEEKVFAPTKKPRTSGFIHIGEIIPGVLRDIEGRIEENAKRQKRNNFAFGKYK